MEEEQKNPEGEHIPQDAQNDSSPETPQTDNGAAPTPDRFPMEESKSDGSSIDRYRQEHDSEVMVIAESLARIKKEVGKVVVGNDKLTEMLMVALFSGGNVLLEGVPGIAKTLSARMLAQSISTEFSRIQFTPDLMPTDILGTTIFNMQSNEFEFHPGPIFSNIILIDEVNRAPAKTQAALMEVMEEKQVTVEGTTHEMAFPFFIIATQNPVEQEGTYKLPEAQMDRFLFRLTMEYPDLNEERQILERFKGDFESRVESTVEPVLDADELRKCMAVVEKIHISNEIIDYIAKIVVATRNNGDLYLGASPRASLSIMKASKALAVIQGRSFVVPDDVRAVTYPVLNHRIILSHEREMEGVSVAEVIKQIVGGVEVPR